jgi:hypothetical protein
MKKLFPSLVAVKKIASAVPRSTFSEADLEKLARLILESGGLINPIIVRRISIDSYEIADGDFEYYAAAKAREIQPLKGETIGAFILEPENESVLLEQVKTLRIPPISEQFGDSETPQTVPAIENAGENETALELPIVDRNPESENFQVASNLEQQLTNVAREKQILIQRIERIKNTLSQQVPRLIETSIEDKISQFKSEPITESSTVIENVKPADRSTAQPMSLLEALNDLDKIQLAANLKAIGLKPQLIQLIIKEREARSFVSFANVVERIKGLSDKTMIKIIDNWQKY